MSDKMTNRKRKDPELPVNNFVVKAALRLDGKYRGYVIDKVDPLGLGRVKVWIPELMSKLEWSSNGIWVHPRFTNEGQHIPPHINQWVMVEFENGDPQLGYYTHTIYHRDESLVELNPYSQEVLNDYPVYPHTNSGEDFDKTLSNEEARKASNAYVIQRTPRKKHKLVMQDDDELDYVELSSGKKKTLVFHDKQDFVQLVSQWGAELLYYKSEFVSLKSAGFGTLEFNDKDKFTVLRSQNGHSLIMDGKTNSVALMNSSSGSMGSQFVDLNYGDYYDTYYMRTTRINSSHLKQLMKLQQILVIPGQSLYMDGISSVTYIHSNGAEIQMWGLTGMVLINPRSVC